MLTVYTCIAGNYDDLIPQPLYEGVKYICFSNILPAQNNYRGWEIRSIENINTVEQNLINRTIKADPFNLKFSTNISMYIDGNVLIKSNPFNFINQFIDSGASIAAFKHPLRENVYQEFDELIATGKLNTDEINKTKILFNRMQNEGYDCKPMMTAGYIILRCHDNKNLKIAMKEWLQIIFHECKRDQISLQYLLWKHKIKMVHLDDFCLPQAFFKRFNHGKYLQFLPRELQDFFKKARYKLSSICVK
ncbi:DUF616 domain-containing protein [Gammaproteobacteria bacterium]|nr:DUF616 domain-containing protein [Gammaproteobacteria bacterium]MDB9842368.1 DUF616 domain-containing protein [Gammaproteobacteria bacterium]